MNTQTGEIYPSARAAILAGVLSANLKMIDPARLTTEQRLKVELMRDHVKGQPVLTVKIGRNENCPCGSGKKFKKCCLSQHMEPQARSYRTQCSTPNHSNPPSSSSA